MRSRKGWRLCMLGKRLSLALMFWLVTDRVG